jgi:iron complex outermembrane receptor protein
MNTSRLLFLSTLSFLLTLQVSFGQTKGKVEGFIKDAEGIPIEFATVRLHSLPDSSAVTGTLSDTSGYYSFENISYGNYFVIVSTIGYTDTYLPSFTLTKDHNKQQFDAVVSEHDASEEILITAQEPFIRQEAGITVVNVEAGILNAGLTAADVLQRTPGATVDKDCIVKLKGKGGVLVLLDGKPLYMDDAQVGALLKSIPADQIKEMEIITSPSAKYDAAGNAGIINIKLKKGAYEGLNGSVNSSIAKGVYPKALIGINLSYKKKKLTLGGGYQYSYKKDLQRSSVNRAYTSFQDSSYYTSTEYAHPKNTQNVLLNGSYDLSAKSTLLWDGTALYQHSTWKGNTESNLYAPSGNRSSYFLTNDQSTSEYYNINSSIGYKYLMDTVGSELFFQGEYKKNNSKSNQVFTTDYYDANGTTTQPSTSYKSYIPVNVDQWGAKADFTKTLVYKIKLEAGVKYMGVKTNANVTSSYVAENNFIYTEHIQAAYATLNKQLNKWKLSGGVRVEHTLSKGEQKTLDSTFNRNYTNFFPSAAVSYQPTEKTSYTVLYSKRIQRPSYHDLNPFIYYSDPYNSYSGNPYLLPEYTHQAELTTSKWNGVFLATLNYSYTLQPLAEGFKIDPNSLATTYTSRNLSNQKNLGVSFSVNSTIKHWWSMNNYVYFYNNSLTGDVGFGMQTVSRPAWMVNATHTFKFPHSISAELSFNYESPNYFGTILYREVWQLSAGVQKKMMHETVSLKLSVTDIFWKYVYVGSGTFGDIKTSDSFKWDNRVLMFSLTYRFGKRIASVLNSNKMPMGDGGGRKK